MGSGSGSLGKAKARARARKARFNYELLNEPELGLGLGLGTSSVAFISRVPHEPRVQWNTNSSACGWVDVTCDAGNTSVVALRLPGVGLVGPIPAGTLGRLTSLRVLSLRANRLSGPIPDDLGNLTLLRSLYLQDNQFSGGIPAAASRLDRLGRLDLSGNNLTGEIPFSINNLTHLTGLFLERNRLSGSLPSISIDSLVDFNVSNNNLNGSIPPTLDRFPESSFAGNLNLCGAPLLPCTPFFPSPAPSPAGNPAGGSKSGEGWDLGVGSRLSSGTWERRPRLERETGSQEESRRLGHA